LVRALGAAVLARKRSSLVAALAALSLLYAHASFTFMAAANGERSPRIVVGAKTFTEQYILSRILATTIERATGRPVDVVSSLGSTVAFDALRAGDIDAYVDYSGTIWATIMRREARGVDRQAVLDEVSRFLKEEHGITLVGALGFENAYAIVMRRARAADLRVRTITDLAPHASRLAVGGDYEFFQRPDRITALDLVVLADERHAIPPYDAVILASSTLTREHPDAATALRGLSGSIDAERMRRMNLAVDQDGKSPEAVAQEFLEGRGSRIKGQE
jgi:osmoprotectant transport system permease protein